MFSDDNNTGDEQDRFRRKLAKWLTITYDELEEYAEDVEPNNGDSNREKYGYFIQFSDATPPEITDKLERLDHNNMVYFNLEDLDTPY